MNAPVSGTGQVNWACILVPGFTFSLRLLIYWTLCSLCWEKNRIKSHSCMSITIQSLLSSLGDTLNLLLVSVVNFFPLFHWFHSISGEQGVVVGLLNSFVHIVMYFYYMVSAMGPEYQKYIWWKKYMTKIQLIQFVLILSYMISISAKNCEMSKGLTYFFVVNTVIFLYLFADFYRKTYNKSKKPVRVENNGKAKTELDCNNNLLDAKKVE